MKIDKVQQNYLQQKTPLKKQAGVASSKASAEPQFTGLKINDIMPYQKAFKWMKNKEWLKGEAGGILITALGTGIVAPIVMGTNPLVRAPKDATEEEKTEVNNKKWYTAMRQPISAVLAVLFQLGALKPIDKFLDKKFNIAENSKHVDLHLDQCEINNKSFREGLAKAQLKAEGKKKPSLFNILTKGFKTTMAEREAYNKAYKDLVDDIGERQVQKVADKFLQTGQIHIGNRQLDNPTLAELVNDRIDEYIKDAKDLKRSNIDMSRYTHKAKLIMNNKDELPELFKDLPAGDKDAEIFIKNLYKKATNPEIKELLEDIMNRDEDLWGSRASRTVDRIKKINEACKGEYSVDSYIDAMARRNAALDRIITKLDLSRIKDPASASEKSITATIQRVAKLCQFNQNDKILKPILQNTITFDFDLNKLMAKIHKDITKGYKELIEHEYKAFNQAAKVGIGVFITLPITCTALNILYPRIMDLCFPSLSGKKKQPAPVEEGGK